MATIKVFDSKGVRELQCFDTLDSVEYLPEEEEVAAPEDPEAAEENPL